MPSPPELSLDCKPHSYSMLLKSFVSDNQVAAPTTTTTTSTNTQDHQQQHSSQNQLEDLLSRLEAERLKIDAFKRELPLCMQLLTNGNFQFLHLLNQYNIQILLIRVFFFR